MDDKDRLISELQGKVAHLSQALRHIDEDVAGAARRYLRCNQGGVLEFSEFLDLLVLEVKDRTRDDHRNRELMRERLHEIVEDRLEREMVALLPALKGRLSDYVTIKVVILVRTHKVQGHLLRKTEPFFKAFSVLGSEVSGGIGRTPEEAYQEVRRQIACRIFGAGTEETARQLAIRDWELAKHFDAAKPFMTDTIEGFKVEARLAEKMPKA